MQIACRGRHIRVPEHRLYRCEIDATRERTGRGRMAERIRREGLNACPLLDGPQPFVERHDGLAEPARSPSHLI